MNSTLNQVKQAIRQPFAWPGGYPVYTIMSDGEMLCADCARKHFRLIAEATKDRHDHHSGWKAYGADVYWEGEPMFCAQCNKELPSAYGAVE